MNTKLNLSTPEIVTPLELFTEKSSDYEPDIKREK